MYLNLHFILIFNLLNIYKIYADCDATYCNYLCTNYTYKVRNTTIKSVCRFDKCICFLDIDTLIPNKLNEDCLTTCQTKFNDNNNLYYGFSKKSYTRSGSGEMNSMCQCGIQINYCVPNDCKELCHYQYGTYISKCQVRDSNYCQCFSITNCNIDCISYYQNVGIVNTNNECYSCLSSYN